MSKASSGWMLTQRPLALVVHWSFKRHEVQVSLGKWTTPPGTKGICCSAGQRIVCRSQSRMKACAGYVFALANGPGFAIHLQIIAALPYQMAAETRLGRCA